MAPACKHVSSSRHAITELKKIIGKDEPKCASCAQEEKAAEDARRSEEESEANITRIKLELEQNPSSKPEHTQLKIIGRRLAITSQEVKSMKQRLQHLITNHKQNQAITKREAKYLASVRHDSIVEHKKKASMLSEEIQKEEARLWKNSLAELYQEDVASLQLLAHSTMDECALVITDIYEVYDSYEPEEQEGGNLALLALLTIVGLAGC